MSESLQDSQQGHSLAMYVVDSPMGRGAGSFVYKVKNRKTQQYAALKVIEKNKDKAEKIKQRIQNEIEVHSTLEHENVVTLYGHFEDKDNFYLLMEVCEGGELYSLVKKKGRLSEEEIRNFGMQFAKGLKYLHSNHILHRDLKLSNLLLTDQNVLKICDFGLAVKLLDLEEERETLCGTPNYISPEIVKNEPYGIKADTWAYGCILYAMATGNPPFEGNSVKETLTKVQVGGLAIPGDLSANLQDLLRKLICMDPKERFSIDDVINHPFFVARTMPPVPPLRKLQSNPLETLCASQNTTGDETPTPTLPDTNRGRGRREINKAFDFNNSESYRGPQSCRQHKASSVACTPETRNRTKNCTGKPPVSLYYQQNNVITCPNSEEKENQKVDNLGESHASQFYKKRQELKKKHRASSKSIVGLPMPSPYSQSWNTSKSRENVLRNLSLNQRTTSDPANGQNPLRMSDLNTQPSLFFNGRSSTASSLGYADNASSVGGEDCHGGYKQYDDRKITPINTAGLKPYKFNIKGGVLEVTETGWIILDLVNSKRKISISPDGGRILVEKTSPFRIEKSYNLNTVPSKYLKFYTYAGQVCETLKTRNQKVKFEEDEGTFTLTQNKPFPTFEARFRTGERVSHTLSSETMRIQMSNGQIFEINVLDDASYLGEQLNCIVKKTLEKMNICIQKSDVGAN